MIIEISDYFDVKDVAGSLCDYKFYDTITPYELINLFDEMKPSDYSELYYRSILEKVEGILPDELVKLLINSTNLLNVIISENEVSPESISYIINNHFSEVKHNVLLNHKLTPEQFKYIVENSSYICPDSLSSCRNVTHNIDLAFWVIDKWETIMKGTDIQEFKNGLFINYSAKLLDDDTCIKLFGFVRPEMSSNDLREYNPCRYGYKRMCKWVTNADHRYSWNEFIARHLLSNQSDVDLVKSDLKWLAENICNS